MDHAQLDAMTEQQIDTLLANNKRLVAALDAARARIAELEAAGHAILLDTDRDPTGCAYVDDAALDAFSALLDAASRRT